MSLKRKLTQEDLRKAMSEHKKKIGTVKKIESPLAKYTDAGQLMCILCKSIVSSEVAWAVHLNSKTHKENIALVKKTKLELEKSAVNTFKRPPSPTPTFVANKKIKSILKSSCQPSMQQNLPADFFDNTSKQARVTAPSVIQKTENVDMETTMKSKETVVPCEKEKEKEKERSKDINQAVLPEGFFDDPIMDAKVRNVEYKDPIEEEWEKFQKEIKEETAQSAQIIADDQEEATTERQLDEIEEQMRYWSRVMDLVKHMEEMQGTERRQENANEDVSSEEESEFDEFIDWRAKNSYK